MADSGGLNTDPRAEGLKLIKEIAIIDGRRIAAGGARIEVDDPSTGEIIGAIPDLGRDEVDEAIAAAADAFPAWSRTPRTERAAIMRRWAALVDAREAALGALLAIENGKPYEEARGEIRYANSFIRWFADQAETLSGESIESPIKGQSIITYREPVGPAALITPWNFPAAMITRKVAPAFAAGCTVVVKPAHQTPFTAIALCELALEAGVPPGAYSVVTGQPSAVGEVLSGSPLIRKLSFTGSTPVGRLLMGQCAPTLKRLSMELGGAAPLVVFEDADIELAIAETIKGKFRNAGQTCVCPNRIYVHRKVLDRFVEGFTAAVAALKVGGPFEPDVKVGPLIDAKGLQKVERHIAWSRAHGFKVTVGGERHARGGLFFQPTVMVGDDDSLFCSEETFGPAAPAIPFDDERQVLERCNASEFGLASYFFSRDIDRVTRFARGLEEGMVGVNTALTSNAVAPFGGVKQSGFGREGSTYGLDEYLSVKAVTFAHR